MTYLKKYSKKQNIKQQYKTEKKAKSRNIDSKNIDKYHYWMYGKHPIIAALKNKDRKIIRFLATEKSYAKLIQDKEIESIIYNRKISVELTEIQQLNAIIGEKIPHQQLVLYVQKLDNIGLDNFLQQLEAKELETKENNLNINNNGNNDDNDNKTKKPALIILDHITDPHNFGAILRSCFAFNVVGVVLQKYNTVDEGAVVAKVSTGALEKLQIIYVNNLKMAIEKIKKANYWCIGLDSKANKEVSALKDFNKVAFIMGAEDKGIRPLILSQCDLLVSLKINSEIDSLNVSNATAIILYEWNNK